MTTVMLVGATGLVGQQVLRLALEQAQAGGGVARVVAPTRRPLPPHPQLINPVLDFEALPETADWWAVDAVVCTLGTTIKLAGSRAAFYRVDHDLPLQVARLALRQGARAYALNSALGASVDSCVFYSRTKGELERDLRVLGYASLTLVRPGLIGGQRAEPRPAEQLGVCLSQWLAPVLPARYRVVPAERIAYHLLVAALAQLPGVRVLMPEELL